MESEMKYLLWLGDAEFSGKSFNGPSLVETLESLTAEEAASTDTYEGYSAWGVALHVLFFKYKLAQALGAEMPAYTYDENGWPALPGKPDAAAYEKMIEDLKTFHKVSMDAVGKATPEQLEKEMPGFKVPIGNFFAWVVAHDTNHNTQIRNMGLAALKEK